MARAWLVDSRGIAKKVKNAAFPSALQIKDCGANRECPNCCCRIDNTDVSSEWPGLPAGVKFDPSDAELLEHLAEKCGNGKQHMLIDEFIPTLEGKGIYSDHPENLPGAKKDGSSIHFFHKTMNAYATGQRKRRKVHNQCCSTAEDVRWHKTGKTKPVVENGALKGFKKIMVLYRSSKGGSKPNKANWVMHQYHLGTEEDEKEGEYVVSKISFQQQKQTDKNDESLLVDESNKVVLRTSPRTPNTNPPVPPRPGKSDICPHVTDDDMLQSPKMLQGAEPIQGDFHRADSDAHFEDDVGYTAWLAGESQAVESSHLDCIDDSLLCNEILDPGFSYLPSANHISKINELTGNNIPSSGIADLENLELDSPPDFQVADLQFCSQESVLDWLDRL